MDVAEFLAARSIEGDLMGLRECEVWAIANGPLRRIRDRVRYGHAKHVCVRDREFGQEHDGDHRCSCGLTYPKGPTDND